MKKITIFGILLLALLLLTVFSSVIKANTTESLPISSNETIADDSKKIINLSMPFVPEAPDGVMIKPWNNACEEATIISIEQYYLGNQDKTMTKEKAKSAMQRYFAIENKIFGSNANTDAAQTAKLINEYSPYFTAQVIQNPTLDQIKEQIDNGNPVIALIYGKGINSRVHFAVNGSYYHMFVIKGYNNKTQKFIVHDNGDLEKGLDLEYNYDTILGALHDYNHKTKKTNGAPTVLFTEQRILVKTMGSNRIYLINDMTKRHITSPSIFKQNNWKWSLVQTVQKDWLDKFNTAEAIK